MNSEPIALQMGAAAKPHAKPRIQSSSRNLPEQQTRGRHFSRVSRTCFWLNARPLRQPGSNPLVFQFAQPVIKMRALRMYRADFRS
jgi:hypothetical protein